MNEIEKSNLIWEGEHVLSHQRLQLKIWHIEKENDSHQIEGYQWIKKVDVENLALPRPLRKIFGEYLLDVT
jgi:adenine-specific DNA glycosylase